MAFLHRKTLRKSMKRDIFVSLNCIHDPDCTKPPGLLKPISQPPPSLATHHSLSPFLIVMFCCLAVTLSCICYLTCAKRCRRNRQANHGNSERETREDLVNENLGPVVHNPVWLINTIGLDESQIESIHVFKYKRDDKLIEGTDCSVCLSEFEEDERLRLLPKCSHAFHVPCIDTWLRSHKNCPLCRAPIINPTDDHETEHAINESNSIESSTNEETETETETETPVSGSETIEDHHHVVDVENNGEMVKTSDVVDETSSRVSVQSDQASNSQRVELKKPSSMPKSKQHKLNGSSSSSGIYVCGKPMKISSFRHSLRKARSYRSKSGPYNQSY
ncbi:hypothetical protein SSX86_019405 [Deinandra increscens subsp. villosa]|uniref:RING-type E3 ubiquitin transferase n=1 Tax=Deinandra increscens subsp. villosa TaxID=3103831 RepID=A0AAP0GVL9_9ASTR